jgi:hypothetical protein
MAHLITIEHITIKCPNDGKLRKNEIDYTTAQVDECELCGEHGEVTLSTKCSCGSRHEVHVDSW